MRKYVIINSKTGKILQIIKWGDDRDIPTNYPIQEGQEILTVDDVEDIQPLDIYDSVSRRFYILDITDNELEIESIKLKLSELELVLSDFQEETWAVLNIDETKLSFTWQDRLLQKRTLRERLVLLV